MTAAAGNMPLGAADIENWRRIAEDRLQKLTDLQTEYAEFQATSRDFEAELERELEAKDRALKEANNNATRIGEERDVLRGRIVNLQAELARLESENDTLRSSEIQSKELIRQLEQKNDDLERSLRATASSLEDLEQRFSQSLEEKALLSSELSEKEALQIAVQRLKDEVRDLRQELSVRVQHEQQSQQRRRNTDANVPPSPTSQNSVTVDQNVSNTAAPHPIPDQNSPQQPAGQTRRGLGVSTRQAALDCVQQLINCVTMMESKVDQLKRRMDREPNNGTSITTNSAIPGTTATSKIAPPLVSSNGINGIGSTSRHNPVQPVTPRRF